MKKLVSKATEGKSHDSPKGSQAKVDAKNDKELKVKNEKKLKAESDKEQKSMIKSQKTKEAASAKLEQER